MAGPCITSPYQIEPANSATKLRFSSSWLAEPSMRDRPCCCSRRWIAERDRLPAADRESGVQGKSVSVRVDLGGRRIIKKKNYKYINVSKFPQLRLNYIY